MDMSKPHSEIPMQPTSLSDGYKNRETSLRSLQPRKHLHSSSIPYYQTILFYLHSSKTALQHGTTCALSNTFQSWIPTIIQPRRKETKRTIAECPIVQLLRPTRNEIARVLVSWAESRANMLVQWTTSRPSYDGTLGLGWRASGLSSLLFLPRVRHTSVDFLVARYRWRGCSHSFK